MLEKSRKNKKVEIKPISISASNSARKVKILCTPTYTMKKKFQIQTNYTPSRSSSKNSNNGNSNSSYFSKVSEHLRTWNNLWNFQNKCLNNGLSIEKREDFSLPNIPNKYKNNKSYSTFYKFYNIELKNIKYKRKCWRKFKMKLRKKK